MALFKARSDANGREDAKDGRFGGQPYHQAGVPTPKLRMVKVPAPEQRYAGTALGPQHTQRRHFAARNVLGETLSRRGFNSEGARPAESFSRAR